MADRSPPAQHGAETHLERAREDLAAAEVLAERFPRIALRSLHLAAHHAVAAVFASEGLEYRSQTALDAAVRRLLVETGAMSEASYLLLTTLRGHRQAADFMIVATDPSIVVQQVRRPAVDFVAAMAALVREGLPDAAASACHQALVHQQEKRGRSYYN